MKTISEDIYQDTIIEWSKKADHTARLDKVDSKATASNPLCGDQVTVELTIEGGVIQRMSHQVRGCVLCKASSSHLAFLAKGLTLGKLRDMRQDLNNALKTQDLEPADFPETHSFFSPVRSHKSRHSCVLLPYDATIDALSRCTK